MTEEKKEKYGVIEVPTATEPMVTDGEKVYTTQEVLVLLLKKVENLEKKLVG